MACAGQEAEWAWTGGGIVFTVVKSFVGSCPVHRHPFLQYAEVMQEWKLRATRRGRGCRLYGCALWLLCLAGTPAAGAQITADERADAWAKAIPRAAMTTTSQTEQSDAPSPTQTPAPSAPPDEWEPGPSVSPEPHLAPAANSEIAFAVYFLNPDAELRVRLRGDTKALSAYIAALARVMEVWMKRHAALPTADPLVAVGVKPGRRARLWCETGTDPASVPTDTLSALSELDAELSRAMPPPVVQGPIALLLGANKNTFSDERPQLPGSSQRAASTQGGPIQIPDMLFQVLWRD